MDKMGVTPVMMATDDDMTAVVTKITRPHCSELITTTELTFYLQDDQIYLVAHMTIWNAPWRPPDKDHVEMILTHPFYRRQGIAKRAWLMAEQMLGRKLVGSSCRPAGERLLASIDREDGVGGCRG